MGFFNFIMLIIILFYYLFVLYLFVPLLYLEGLRYKISPNIGEIMAR